jgi:hypothetical protein
MIEKLAQACVYCKNMRLYADFFEIRRAVNDVPGSTILELPNVTIFSKKKTMDSALKIWKEY